MPILLTIFAIASCAIALVFWLRNQRLRREDFIRHAELPRGLFEKLMKRHPQLSLKDCQLVAHGLRQFFLAHLKSGRKFVSMPSQVVDDLWHEFILYTKNYDLFCRRAFGRFMHHTPAVVLSSHAVMNEGLRRCWWYSCKEENIDPASPTRLPLLFALDAKLSVAGGFTYVPDCKGFRRTDPGSSAGATYCGGDFGSDAFDGGTAGFDDAGGDGGGGGSGDGCGGGGCGGGD
jgi:hypothetical protein